MAQAKFEQREGNGALFKNRNKKQPNHSDYQGEIKINGQLYWLNGWIKKDRNNDPFISLAIKIKQAQLTGQPRREYDDEEIPF
jgi:hypothetical protein